MGAALVAEIEAVTSRPMIKKKCILSEKEQADLLDAFFNVCKWVSVYFVWRPNLRDESDNHLIELAVAGGADYLVTQNVRDVSAGELRFPNIKIATPAQFLKAEGLK